MNSSLKSLLSSAMRRFISSSSLSTGSGGYFLFVLGERANNGTLWSSVPDKQEGRRRERGSGIRARQVEIKQGEGKWDLNWRQATPTSFLQNAHRGALLFNTGIQEQPCRLGNHTKQKHSGKSICSYHLQKSTSFMKWIWLNRNRHEHSRLLTHAKRSLNTDVLPVSSERPLVSLKELEWLPACLYFLNLSIKIHQSSFLNKCVCLCEGANLTSRHWPEHVEDDNDEDDDQQGWQGHHDCYDWHVNRLVVVFRVTKING